MRQLTLAAGLVTVALVFTTFNAQAQRNGMDGAFDKTLNVLGTVDLDVSTGSGTIEIRPGSSGKVEIHGRIRVQTDWRRSDRNADDIVRQIESKPPIVQNGNIVRIDGLQGREYDNVSISYEILVPSQATIKSHSGSGGITVNGIAGPVDATTGSGSITLTNIQGRVHSTTGSGSIHADGIALKNGANDVDLSTGSGTIHATGIKAALTAHTGSGGITVEGEQTGRWELQTGSGSINVRLPNNAGFDLSAHASSGGVYVDQPLTVQGRIDTRRHDISGKVRNGGYTLEVRTGSGSIRIE